VFAGHFFDQGKLGYPVNDRHQGALVVFADNGINFPVTQAYFFAHYHRPVINADPVPDLPPLVLGTVLLALLAAVPKVLVQRAASQLVRPDMLGRKNIECSPHYASFMRATC